MSSSPVESYSVAPNVWELSTSVYAPPRQLVDVLAPPRPLVDDVPAPPSPPVDDVPASQRSQEVPSRLDDATPFEQLLTSLGCEFTILKSKPMCRES